MQNCDICFSLNESLIICLMGVRERVDEKSANGLTGKRLAAPLSDKAESILCSSSIP
jgi:hypothetical protein